MPEAVENILLNSHLDVFFSYLPLFVETIHIISLYIHVSQAQAGTLFPFYPAARSEFFFGNLITWINRSIHPHFTYRNDKTATPIKLKQTLLRKHWGFMLSSSFT